MLRMRWTVLAVCVLLLVALPQGAYVADIGVTNGDFSLTSSLPPLPWIQTGTSGGPGILSTVVYHTAPRSLGVGGSNSIEYFQCIDTSTWSGRVEIGGWVHMNGDAYDTYDPANGLITVTWYDESGCGGDGTPLVLSLTGGQDTWAHLSEVIDLPSIPRVTHVSMKVVLYGKGGEAVYLDDIYATAAPPTSVALGEFAAQPGALPEAVLLVGAFGAVLYGLRRVRGRARLYARRR